MSEYIWQEKESNEEEWGALQERVKEIDKKQGELIGVNIFTKTLIVKAKKEDSDFLNQYIKDIFENANKNKHGANEK